MLRILTILLCFLGLSTATLPIVLWHGMGDSCCKYGSLYKIIELLNKKIPDATVLSLKFGNSVVKDVESGYFMNSNKQVDLACQQIRANDAMKNGYNAVGFSQGGQFLRAVAQRCPNPPMKILITLGGQHQGVFGLPKCTSAGPAWCTYIRRLLNTEAYSGWVQNSLVQAQYWHDPIHEDKYREHSIFLADINNEKPVVNTDYIKNLKKLEKIVLVKFNNDTIVIPKETSWFGFYAPGQADKVIPYNETRVYAEDLLGLQKLINNGKIDFLSVDGDHLQFSTQWFIDTIIRPYLM